MLSKQAELNSPGSNVVMMGTGGARGLRTAGAGASRVHRMLLALLQGLTSLSATVGSVSSGANGGIVGPLLLSAPAAFPSGSSPGLEARTAVAEAQQERLLEDVARLQSEVERERAARAAEVASERERARLQVEEARHAAERAAADLEADGDGGLPGHYRLALIKARTAAAEAQQRLVLSEQTCGSLKKQVASLERALQEKEAEAEALRTSRAAAARAAEAARDEAERAGEAAAAAGFVASESEAGSRRTAAEMEASLRRAEERIHSAETATVRCRAEAAAARAAQRAAEDREAEAKAAFSALRSSLREQEDDIRAALAVVQRRSGRRAGSPSELATGGASSQAEMPWLEPAEVEGQAVWDAISRVQQLKEELARLDNASRD